MLSRAELGFGVSWGWGEVGGEFGAEAGEAFGEDLEDCRLWAVGGRVKGLRPHAVFFAGIGWGLLGKFLHGGAGTGERGYDSLGSVLGDVRINLGCAYIGVPQ